MKKLAFFLLLAGLLAYLVPASVWHGLVYLVGFAICSVILLCITFCIWLFVRNERDKKAKLEIELRNKDVRLTIEQEPAPATSTTDDARTGIDSEKARTAIAAVTGTMWRELSQPEKQNDRRLQFAGAFLKAARTCFANGMFAQAMGFAHQAESVRSNLMAVPDDFDPRATTIAIS